MICSAQVSLSSRTARPCSPRCHSCAEAAATVHGSQTPRRPHGGVAASTRVPGQHALPFPTRPVPKPRGLHLEQGTTVPTSQPGHPAAPDSCHLLTHALPRVAAEEVPRPPRTAWSCPSALPAVLGAPARTLRRPLPVSSLPAHSVPALPYSNRKPS